MAKQGKNTVGRPKSDKVLETQLAVRVSGEVREKLNRKAQELDRSIGWLLRNAVEEWLERNP